MCGASGYLRPGEAGQSRRETAQGGEKENAESSGRALLSSRHWPDTFQESVVCELGTLIVILQMQRNEDLRSQVTCPTSHSLFLVKPRFKQEPLDSRAWPVPLYTRPP